MTPILVGLAGLSGAGKSTLADHLERQGGVKRFRFDAYYKDESDCPTIQGRPHWDLPESLHLDQVADALAQLKQGNEIWLPVYSRKENRRTGVTLYEPAPVIFAEGLMLFSDERIRNLIDLRLWLDVSEEVAFARRLQRQPEYDATYHWNVAAPAARAFVAPYKSQCHAVIDGSGTIAEVAAEGDAVLHQFLGIASR